jgi:hypothetical protein
MFKNTFFAKEPRFLKVIYVLAFLGIVYNIYLLIFTQNDIDYLLRLFCTATFGFFYFRKMLKDQKKN